MKIVGSEICYDDKELSATVTVHYEKSTCLIYAADYTLVDGFWISNTMCPVAKRIQEVDVYRYKYAWLYHSKNKEVVSAIKWKLRVPQNIVTLYLMSQEENKIFDCAALFTHELEVAKKEVQV